MRPRPAHTVNQQHCFSFIKYSSYYNEKPTVVCAVIMFTVHAFGTHTHTWLRNFESVLFRSKTIDFLFFYTFLTCNHHST